MSKYLYFQDGHIDKNNPSSRIDDFYKSWMKKFKELMNLAKEYKVTAILDGGDLLNIPKVADSIVDDILDLIEEYKIPFYSLWGNHSLIGHHKETSGNTSMKHMFRRCKFLKDCSGGMEVGTDYHIDFIDYDHNIEEKIKKEGINIDSKDTYWKIAIVHAFVTSKPFLPTVLHVVADEIQTNANLVLVAHYHEVWNKKVGNTEYVDIGCFGRRSISEANIHPSVIILNTEKRSYEIIKLKSAKAGNLVFDLSKKEETQSKERELELFINSLRDFEVQGTDVRNNIEFIAKEQNIERPVIDRILDKLKEVQK